MRLQTSATNQADGAANTPISPPPHESGGNSAPRTLDDALRLHSVNALSAELSHRLSQPLTAITYYCEILLQILEHQTDATISDAYPYVSRILEQVQRAGGMIEKLRDPGRGGVCAMETIAPRSVLEAAVALQRPHFTAPQATLDLFCEEPLPTIRGDPLQLVHVFRNLISNGYEAVCDSGPVTVVLRARSIDEGLHVSVSDNGPGVERNRVHHIFDLFESSKPGRLGFGLGISRSIINAHGGRLWCEAESEAGAVFHVILPAEEATCPPGP